MDDPIVGIGHMDIEVDGQTKRVGVTRAHLEEVVFVDASR
jgi:aspartyl-tRNA(Asn)/glutamyl-tRNA(Gln) amidotransferase subunit B